VKELIEKIQKILSEIDDRLDEADEHVTFKDLKIKVYEFQKALERNGKINVG